MGQFNNWGCGGGADRNLPQLWHNKWMREVHMDAIGRSGGIVVMWDKRYREGKLVECGNQTLTCKLVGIASRFHLVL